MKENKIFNSIRWTGRSLVLLDQRKIPFKKEYIECLNLEQTIEAIKKMVVRGAPAIALSGIYGFCLYLIGLRLKPQLQEMEIQLNNLLNSRPTAVNLKLAIERYKDTILSDNFSNESLESLVTKSIDFANFIYNEDLEINLKIAENGSLLFSKGSRELSILTHCNTGALATAGIGTAIGVLRILKAKGFNLTVYASETRPYHQGSRLTSWELKEEGIECYIISDSMSAYIMKEKKIDAVLVGADRITGKGDTANKIGTFSHAIIAREFKIPFYVAASSSSFDFSILDGNDIHIEMRAESELTQNSFLKDESGNNYIPEGVLAPMGARALNPSFDVTPAGYITGIITEKGNIIPVNEDNIKNMIVSNY